MARVKAHFVPVTLNADRLPATPDGVFFKGLLTRWPQGLWVVTPAGKTLGFHYHTPKPGDTFKQNQARWVADTGAMLDAALKDAGPLAPRTVQATNPFPDRGVGRTRDKGVRLALTVTATRAGKPEGAPVFDSFVLTAADWATFAPPANGAKTWTISETAAEKFAPALSPLTDSIFVPRPADVFTAVVTAALERASPDVLVIRYRGEWKSRHLRDGQAAQPIPATLTGEAVGIADPATRELRSLLWVLTGTYQKGPGAPVIPTAAVVEWRGK